MTLVQKEFSVFQNFWSTGQLGACGMIIGRDVMQFLGIDICFSDLTIQWDGNGMPFKPVAATAELDCHIEETMAANEATDLHCACVHLDCPQGSVPIDCNASEAKLEFQCQFVKI